LRRGNVIKGRDLWRGGPGSLKSEIFLLADPGSGRVYENLIESPKYYLIFHFQDWRFEALGKVGGARIELVSNL
jgi:hypothetical protein